MRHCLAPLIVALAACITAPSHARAGAAPAFSDTGPDAPAYGAVEHYPLGTPGHTRDQRVLVGSFSHYDSILPSHPVHRAETPFEFKRAPAEITLTYSHSGNEHTLADYLERHPATGFLILKDGTILFEHYRYARTDKDRRIKNHLRQIEALLGHPVTIAKAA